MVPDPTLHEYCVILAGGTGSRFWPYSRESHPKQFIDFLGTGKSLLQLSYHRYLKHFPRERLLVVSNVDYLQQLRDQLPELPAECLLLEPTHRNTAPAIAYAARHIYARDPEAVITIAPCDHLVIAPEEFVELAVKGCRLADKPGEIVTIGIRPTYPETNYGYIQAVAREERAGEDAKDQPYEVKTFTEKPNAEMAQVLMDSGEFFWNSGLFIARAKTFIDELKWHLPELTERLYAREDVWGTDEEEDYVRTVLPYSPNISFDYAVMEKAEHVTMLLSDAGWVDLGTWSAIHSMAEKDAQGNAVLGPGPKICNSCRNTLVVSEAPDRLIALEGMEDVVVIDHKDVLLVCKINDLDKIKQLIFDAGSIDRKFVE
nr:sugar phosphate nucleotidyltransferase [uncultured Porphyromonas sp.]